MEFLSTLSLRRATLQAPPPRRPQRHFYPRSPCGERQRTQAGSRHNTAISIHALLAESDQQSRGSYIRTEKFLSTLSLRRATNPVVDVRRATGTAISIHALLAESDDTLVTTHVIFCAYFYPRSPCGERRERGLQDHSSTDISIHALLAESDVTVLAVLVTGQDISIHALLAESDDISHELEAQTRRFLSTLSLRRATLGVNCGEAHKTDFYPRSPCGERRFAFVSLQENQYFYPRSPCGERPNIMDPNTAAKAFLSTLSLRRATAKVHKTVGHFCAYETTFMGIASSC